MTRIEHRSLKTGGKDDWETPHDLLAKIKEFRTIDLDPATTADNPLGARVIFTKESDGLLGSWTYEFVFFNPPYSQTKDWLRKAMKRDRDRFDRCEVVIETHNLTIGGPV